MKLKQDVSKDRTGNEAVDSVLTFKRRQSSAQILTTVTNGHLFDAKVHEVTAFAVEPRDLAVLDSVNAFKKFSIENSYKKVLRLGE